MRFLQYCDFLSLLNPQIHFLSILQHFNRKYSMEPSNGRFYWTAYQTTSRIYQYPQNQQGTTLKDLRL